MNFTLLHRNIDVSDVNDGNPALFLKNTETKQELNLGLVTVKNNVMDGLIIDSQHKFSLESIMAESNKNFIKLIN